MDKLVEQSSGVNWATMHPAQHDCPTHHQVAGAAPNLETILTTDCAEHLEITSRNNTQSGASSLSKHGGAYFLAVYWSIPHLPMFMAYGPMARWP